MEQNMDDGLDAELIPVHASLLQSGVCITPQTHGFLTDSERSFNRE